VDTRDGPAQVSPAPYPAGTAEAFERRYVELYESRYGKKPLVFRDKERSVTHSILVRIFQGGDDLAVALAALERFFKSDRPFFAGHGVGKLLSQLDEFMVDPPPPPAPRMSAYEKQMAVIEESLKSMHEGNVSGD
jgi:hypothetical protein